MKIKESPQQYSYLEVLDNLLAQLLYAAAGEDTSGPLAQLGGNTSVEKSITTVTRVNMVNGDVT